MSDERLKAFGLQCGIGSIATVTSLEQAADVLEQSRQRPGYKFSYVSAWPDADGRLQSSVRVVCFFAVDDFQGVHHGMPMLLEASA